MPAKAKRYYGMHFYNGICGYTDPKTKADFRVYVNEDTIRKMDPDFSGCPVFVEHVDEVGEDISQLRNDAAGWVVRSFYNEADSKHWVEFMIADDEGDDAIARGYRLSNCYAPESFGPPGRLNGVDYDKQMLDGKYHHLALVRKPRYNESVVLTPAQFKEYNESQVKDLEKYANHLDDEEEETMGLTFFTREKIKNGDEIAKQLVMLPKSKREVSIETLCNEADEAAVAGTGKASMKMMVTVDGEEMTVADLIEKYTTLESEVSLATKDKDTDNDDDDDDDDDETENDDDDKTPPKKTKNSDDKKSKKPVKRERTDEERKASKKFKNSGDDQDDNLENDDDVEYIVDTGEDQRARGKSRYGSIRK